MINFLLSESKRSENYLKSVYKNKIKISKIIYFSKNKKVVSNFIKKRDLIKNTIFVKSNTVNSPVVKKALTKINNNFPIIYSGYSGEIIKNNNILKRNLIHFHPGDLPSYKGSTTIFYSLILKKKITVTCFKMTNIIDKGTILYKKNFKKPSTLNQLNNSYDHKIRAETMVEFIKKGKKKYKIKKNSKNFDVYYIAHPIIRGITIHNKQLKHLYKSNDPRYKSRHTNKFA